VVHRDKALWTDLTLGRPGNPRQLFAKFLQSHQEIRSFVVRDGTDFLPTTGKLTNLLFGLPRLERVCLTAGSRHRSQQPDESIIGQKKAKSSVTQLSLIGFHEQAPFRKHLELTCDTLEALDLANTSNGVMDTFGSVVFPKLRKLRLTESATEPSYRPLPMIEMVSCHWSRFHIS
jgi:hypothetical protein